MNRPVSVLFVALMHYKCFSGHTTNRVHLCGIVASGTNIEDAMLALTVGLWLVLQPFRHEKNSTALLQQDLLRSCFQLLVFSLETVTPDCFTMAGDVRQLEK